MNSASDIWLLGASVVPLAGVDYCYSMNGYRGRYIKGSSSHAVCRHEHRTVDAAIRCGNRLARKYRGRRI